MKSSYKNRLEHETSPYLLQHADNPVDWYPWGNDAINRARSENKPILLSIGYAACHWCHVMAHESFENEETAKLMNDLFVCIKVDREERPDIDQIYMQFVQMSSGSGGWPLNVFLTPELEPFFGGTYFPPTDRYGRASWKKVLSSVSDFYHNRKTNLNQNLELIRDAFKKNIQNPPAGELPDISVLTTAARSLARMYDPNYGGFGRSPKFPPVIPLLFFLRIHKNTGEEQYLEMVCSTLRNMARGGIYDQLGGGFARYAVDEKWLVPHFEKMLYDNALLAVLYLETYQITKNIFFLHIAEDILAFVDREMRSSEGGFYSSLDADSEGEEGKFYVWSKKEIDKLLGKNSPVFCDYYNVIEAGNFDGKNILHIQSDMANTAARFDLTLEEVKNILVAGREKLFAARALRIQPGLDNKMLTSWNALMLSAYSYAYQITHTPRFAEIIRSGIKFIKSKLYVAEDLLRSYNKGKARYKGYIEDYSFLIQALLDAYEAIFDPEYLDWANSLMNQANTGFWDDKHGGYFTAEENQKELIFRLKDDHDQSVPCGTAVMLMNHLRFYSLTENPLHIQRAEIILKKYSYHMTENPYAYSSYLLGLDFYIEKPKEIIIVVPSDQNDPFTQEINKLYLPNRIIVRLDSDNLPQMLSASLLKDKITLNKKPTAYICHNFTCSPPVQSLQDILKLLQN